MSDEETYKYQFDEDAYGLTYLKWYRDIGAALREVTGSNKQYYPHEMAPEILKLKMQKKIARVDVDIYPGQIHLTPIIEQVTINGNDTNKIIKVTSDVTPPVISEIETTVSVWAQINE